MKKSSENVVHIKLDYEEAIMAKRSLLFSKMNALNSAKRLGRYRFLRMEELALRTKLYNKLKETRSNIKKLQSILPEAKMPKIIRKSHPQEEHLEAGSKVHKQPEDIESQLREIEKRIEDLKV